MFKLLGGQSEAQRGITGLETAIILIAFVVVASVFAFTVLTTGVFSSERSKETVYAGLDEVRSSLEPRGSVIAFKGRYGTTASTDTIYKISFLVASAVGGESIDLTPPYTANGTTLDPDIDATAQSKVVVSYSDDSQYMGDLPWSIDWPGYDNGDNVLDSGEKAEITVWLFDRDFAQTNATDNNGIVLMAAGGGGGAGGFASTTNVPGVNDSWTLEVKPESGATLSIERKMPGRLSTVMDLC